MNQMGREHLRVPLPQSGIQHLARLPSEPLDRPLAPVGEEGDNRVQQRRRYPTDRPQLVNGAEGDQTGADHLLRPLRQLEDLHARGDPGLRPAERRGGTISVSPRSSIALTAWASSVAES